MLRHWSQFVPNMSTDIRGHQALHHHHHHQFESSVTNLGLLPSAEHQSEIGGRMPETSAWSLRHLCTMLNHTSVFTAGEQTKYMRCTRKIHVVSSSEKVETGWTQGKWYVKPKWIFCGILTTNSEHSTRPRKISIWVPFFLSNRQHVKSVVFQGHKDI